MKIFKKQTGPLWKGPEEDGITFSMLSRFLVCRERFRLYALEGFKPADHFNHRIEYGQMWHTCEEALAGDRAWIAELTRYTRTLLLKYPLQQEQVEHWYSVCTVQFPLYVDWWAKHPDVLDRAPLLQEEVFNIPYKLPSGRTVKLRGKFDSVDLIGKGKGAGVYLQENKTKGDINERQLQRQLTFDLQTMLYLVALNTDGEHKYIIDEQLKHDWSILGVRYNVVRRPLSGGKGTIVQHKPSKKNPQGESKDEFYGRLAQYIKDEPQTYFMRWKCEVTAGDIAKFRSECLDPILEQLCDWYDWIRFVETEKIQLWDNDVQFGVCCKDDKTHASAIHWRHPFGVYNVLDEGGSSDLDEYLATGSELGLQRVNKLFTELEA